MKDKHSPLPWREARYDQNSIMTREKMGCPPVVAVVTHPEDRPLIVTAVNSLPAFDALIKAAGEAHRCEAGMCTPCDDLETTIAEAKKARGI